jgi:hypothetical protein
MSIKLDAITFTSNFKDLELFLSAFKFKFGFNEGFNVCLVNYESSLQKVDHKTLLYNNSIGSKIVKLKQDSKSNLEISELLKDEIQQYELFCQQNKVLNIAFIYPDNSRYAEGLSNLDKDLLMPNTSYINYIIPTDKKVLSLVDDVYNLIISMGYELKKGA